MIDARSHDLAVVGAGPAGATAALEAARRGLSVALFEPRTGVDKPCGEGILPAGVEVLAELGFDALLARGRKLERIRYVLASGREVEIPFPAAGRALERPVLAAALEEALGSEPRIRRFALRVRTVRTAEGFRVESAGETWSARCLIAADGLLGEAASWLRAPRGGGRRTGLRARARATAPLEHVEVHLGRTSEVYLTPLPDGLVNVAVLRDELPEGSHGARALLADALAEHPRAARRLGGWVTWPESRLLARAAPLRVAERGAFLAGDATGSVDPVLGCGVTIALVTGRAAGRAATERLHGARGIEARYARLVRSETRLRRRLARGLGLLARHPWLQERVGSGLETWPAAGAWLARRVAGG